MKKYLLLPVLIISFVFLYPSVVQAAEEPHITLRSSYRDLTVPQVRIILNVLVHKIHNYGFYGYSTINNSYESKSINGDSVVIDHVTGLMWHQSGSDKDMEWDKAKQWVTDLNSREYAGYHDWRLPTVEEAISLLESDKKDSGLFIDTVFDIKQSGTWTGDENDSASYLDGAWGVRFGGSYDSGNVCWRYDNAKNHVRPVRSMK